MISLNINSVEITNIVKAPEFCEENDEVKLVVSLQDVSSDQVQTPFDFDGQKVTSKYAAIQKNRNNHKINLTWNETFQFNSK